jgi:hypothetical protein
VQAIASKNYKKEREGVFVKDVPLAAYTFMCPCDVS